MVREVSGNLRPIEGTKTPFTPKIPSKISELDEMPRQGKDPFLCAASLRTVTGGSDRGPQGNATLRRTP
jgi:hypothetical protein